ncbi:MAG: hypothetical protein LDL25_00525 [Hyphomicrobiales bacterium]|uniref:hypothetical protein n=1 Tax=Rhabdaerophilum calidifontis TaxID=2604328 RepID=UPI00123C2274|nr:hypothetical protein [Rhabdaerophilum calidifontis]MCA1952194.1 hypothetical protein [Hyphomicrobiales bacterium]MCA1998248.1 hypothetical protein [Hyphomicrobiales bacterium]
MHLKAMIARALLSLALLGGAFAGMAALAPASAQDGIIMRNILGRIGLLPEEKEPIEYRERPGLVVPKQLDTLRPPEPTEGHTKSAQWPKDPDVVARDRERARRNAGGLFPSRNDPIEGGRLSVNEMAAGRSGRRDTLGESSIPINDKAGVRMSIEDIDAAQRTASAPSYPPGTEPPRRYLTDPPTGLRLPASTAPIGRKTGSDGPAVDNLKVNDAWKRQD